MGIPYNRKYYLSLNASAIRSANVVVPLLLKLIKPKSVIDVGCGAGMWLSVFGELGIRDFYGIDGKYVPVGQLQIDKERFIPLDLSQKINLKRQFDLVICLEVGEHLLHAKANIFIENLVKMGDVIVFSAAIPGQQGEGHINEQWPQYWQDKFRGKGYLLIDCLRREIWNNPRVDWWHKQNTFIYVKNSKIRYYPKLLSACHKTDNSMISLVHPECFNNILNNYPRGIIPLLKKLISRVGIRSGLKKPRQGFLE